MFFFFDKILKLFGNKKNFIYICNVLKKHGVKGLSDDQLKLPNILDIAW